MSTEHTDAPPDFPSVVERKHTSTKAKNVTTAYKAAFEELAQGYNVMEAKHRAAERLIADQNKLAKERQEWALHTNEVIRGLNARIAAQGDDTKPKELPLDEHTRHILGFICYQCRPYAEMLRAEGHEIPAKAEEEQAAVLHWMLNHYLKHGKDWREHAGKQIEAHIAARSPAAGGSKELKS